MKLPKLEISPDKNDKLTKCLPFPFRVVMGILMLSVNHIERRDLRKEPIA